MRVNGSAAAGVIEIAKYSVIAACVCPAWASFRMKIRINLEGESPLWAGVTPRTISKSQG